MQLFDFFSAIQKLNAIDMSLVRKDAIREEVKTIRKAIGDASKALEKEQMAQVILLPFLLQCVFLYSQHALL